MKKISRKILSVLLVIAMLVPTGSLMVNTSAAAAKSGKCGNNLTWTFFSETGVLEINGIGEMTDYTYHYNSEFKLHKYQTKQIIVSEGVKTIGEYAFREFVVLEKVSLPETLVSIDACAFDKCTGLKNVIIPKNVETIGMCAFSECEKIEEIIIPDSVSSLGNSAFSRCKNLKTVQLSKNITKIESGTFYGCENLVEIEFPGKITSIGTQAFQGCDSFVEFHVPEGVTSLETHVLCGCDNLEKVYISSSVSKLNWSAFIYCNNLKKIIVDEQNENFSNDENGVVFSKDKKKLIVYPTGNTSEEYIIPNGVTTIGAGAFCGVYTSETNIYNGGYCNKYLKTVTIPKSVTEIQNCAFYYFTALKNVCYSGTEKDWNSIKKGEDLFYKASPKYYYNGIKKEYDVVGRKFDANIDYYTNFWDSSIYNANLANLTAALSAAVYSETNIAEAYATLGFENFNVYDYDDGFDPYSCGYALDFKKSEYNDDTICLVTVRGSDNTSDWIGNFSMDIIEDGKHLGFAFPAYRISKQIESLIQERNITGNIKYVITGHSRGAAVANLLAVKLMENGVNPSDVYNYNFACPDVACKYSFASYSNIFNLCNREDPVPFVPGNLVSLIAPPGMSWGKFGQTYWFTKDAEDTISPTADHNIWLYLEFFDKRLNPDQWEVSFSDKFDDTALWVHGWISKILCPVDVVITDTDGNRIASVIGGKVNYYDSNFGDVIIFTDGDKKVIFVSGDRDFNIELIGTDDGTMTYSVEKCNLMTDEILESKTFENVKLKNGKEMYSPVGNAETTEDIELFVVENENGEDVKTHTINTDGSETEIYHIYDTIIIDPTCTEKGYTLNKCKNCDDSYEDEYIDALGHTDENSDGVCDVCAEDFTKSCSCSCHSNAFMQFLHKILCFLYRIFGMEQYRYCGCGKAHW